MLRILLFTSNHLRHKYIAHCLTYEAKLLAVVIEQKSERVEKPKFLTPERQTINDVHFERRYNSEKEFFSQYLNFPNNAALLSIPNGAINSNEVINFISSFDFDYIVLFGSSIVKNTILDNYSNRIINLHLGLSPYYRGSATNLFPLYYGQPECVGATIHLANEKVDAGDVLYQLRPNLDGSEDLYQIGNKVIQKAGKILPKVIYNFDKGIIIPQKQDFSKGREFKNRDYFPEMVIDIEKRINDGMIRKYVSNKEYFDAKFPIISPELKEM